MSASLQMQRVGRITELAGAGGFAVAVILSLQHYAIAVLLICGAGAFFVAENFVEFDDSTEAHS